MIRFSFVILTNLLYCFVLADGFGGTKSDPVGLGNQTAVAPIGVGSVFQTILALVVVASVVKFVLPKLAGKFTKRLVTETGSAIRIEESAVFAGGSLYVVSARGKTLLLSVSTSGVSNLADLTGGKAEPDGPPTFQELVESSPIAAPGSFAAVRSDPSSSDVEAALARLDRLAR